MNLNDPFFLLNNITANIDSGIDDYITKTSNPNQSKLRAIQLKSNSSSNESQTI